MGKNICFDLFPLHNQKLGNAVFVLFKRTIYCM